MLVLLTLVACQAEVPPPAPTSTATDAETSATDSADAPPAPAPSTPPQAPSCTLAVLDLEAGEGMSKQRASALSDVITGEVGALSGCSVLSRSDVRGVLSFEAEKQLLGCSSDSSCLAELAGALGADLIVTGSVSKIERSMLLSLRMTDLKQLKVVRRATDTFMGSDDRAIPFVAWLARKLMTDDPKAVGDKPVAVAKSAVAPAEPEKRGTVWGTLAWTGVVVTSVAGGLTLAFGGTTLGLSEYLKEIKTNSDFADGSTIESLTTFGNVAADATNIGVYTTAGLVALTVPLFFLPHEEPAEAP